MVLDYQFWTLVIAVVALYPTARQIFLDLKILVQKYWNKV